MVGASTPLPSSCSSQTPLLGSLMLGELVATRRRRRTVDTMKLRIGMPNAPNCPFASPFRNVSNAAVSMVIARADQVRA